MGSAATALAIVGRAAAAAATVAAAVAATHLPPDMPYYYKGCGCDDEIYY